MRRLREFYDSQFLLIEFFLSVAVAGAVIYGTERVWGEGTLMAALEETRQPIYTALASAGGSLLGFIITAVSILMLFGQMPRFNLLRDIGRYGEAFAVFFQAIQWLGVATVWSILGIRLDTDSSPKPWFTVLMLWLAVLSAFRVCRCVWLMKVLATLAARRSTRTLGSPSVD